MIKLKNITKHFQSFSIQSLNYTFENKLYQLQGDNGSGKSVLLKIIAGLDRNIKGEVVNTKKKISNFVLNRYWYRTSLCYN